MENITRKAERMVRGNAKRRNWKRFVAIPAALVVFITTYALILPAIAMEGDVYCGFEAHTHTDECYKSVLACGYESGEMVEKTVQVTELACTAAAHQHTEACFDETGAVICGYADYMVHTHNADCYDANGNLVCPLPQVEAHTHDEGCYVEEIVNVCGQAESAGHVHTEACYTLQSHPELVCGQAESAGHIHTEACYTTTENTYLACGQEESAGHIHTDACYTTVVAEDGTESIELTCGQAESAGHTHTDACYVTEPVIELTCGQAESAGHTHTDACWVNVEEMVLSCGQEESAGHTHTDECFAVQKTLVCNKPEVILHTHNEDCIATYIAEDGTEVPYLACGMTEVQEHVHSAECFNTYEQTTATPHEHTDICYVLNLDCTLPEHVHTQECYQAPEAETEAPADEQIVDEAAEITDETVEAPETEAEVAEAAEPALICELAEHTHDETCYDENGELFCGLEEHTHGEGCYAAAEVTDETAEAPEAEAEIEAAPEMVLICDQLMHEHTDACYAEAVCGLAEHTHDETCYDENGELVCQLPEHTHTADCAGVVMIDEDEAPEAFMPELICGKEEHIHTAECMNSNLEYICGKEAHEHTADCWAKPFMSKTFFDGNVTVTATYTAKANIPEEAYLKAYKVTAESDPVRYAARVAQANAMLGDGQHADQLAIYNIGFYIDGREIEPEDAVQVEIKFLDANGFVVDDTVSVVHFAESGTELIEASADSQGNAASFETGSFSDFLLSMGGWPEEPSFEGQMEPQATQAPEAETGETETTGETDVNVEMFMAEVVDGVIYEVQEAQVEESAEPAFDGIQMDGPSFDGAMMDAPEAGGDDQEYGIMTVAEPTPTPVPVTPSSDLSDFLDADGVHIKDKSGTEIGPDGTLYVGESYDIELKFTEEMGKRQMADELVYEIPGAFDIKDSAKYTATKELDGKTVEYEYWVENGKLHLKFADGKGPDQLQNLGITVTLEAELKSNVRDGEVDIPLSGDQTLKFHTQDDPLPTVKKSNSGFDAATRKVHYSVDVTADHGTLLKGWTFKDDLEDSSSCYLKYEDPVTCTYTIRDKDGKVISTGTKQVSHNEKDKFTVSDFPEIPDGCTMTVEYDAVFDESKKDAFRDDGLGIKWREENNTVTVTPKDSSDSVESSSKVTVSSHFLEKNGSLDGNNKIKWKIDIGDGYSKGFGGSTVTDTASEGLTFDLKTGDKLKLDVYNPAGEKVGEVEVTVTVNDRTMTYTLPTDEEVWNKFPGLGRGAYYLKGEYTTTYPEPGVNESATYTNTIETTINNKTSKDDDDVTVVGPVGDITKEIVNGTTAFNEEEGYLEYKVTIPVPALKLGDDENRTPFRFSDRLRFEDAGGSGVDYYVENIPEDLKIVLKDNVRGIEETLREGGSKDTPNTYAYGTYKDRVHYFAVVFNWDDITSWPSNDGSGTHLELVNPSTLTITYRIDLDRPVYVSLNPDKENKGDGPFELVEGTTVRELLNKGYTLNNECDRTIAGDSDSTEVDYTNPKLDMGILKSGTLRQDETTGKYYVDYEVLVNNPVNPQVPDRLMITDVEDLQFSDTFNKYLKYVPGSLHVEVWAPNRMEGDADYYPSEGDVSVTEAGDGNTTITAQGSDFNNRVSHKGDDLSLWEDQSDDGVNYPNYGDWSISSSKTNTFANGVSYYSGEMEYKDWNTGGQVHHKPEPHMFIFKYTCEVDKDLALEQVASSVDLLNTAHVDNGDWHAGDDFKIDFPTGKMTKNAEVVTDDAGNLTNHVTFTIDFNNGCDDLVKPTAEDSTDSITLNDVMSPNLRVLVSTVKVTVQHKEDQAPVEYTDFVLDVDEENHTMTISNLPDEAHVVVTYECMIDDAVIGGNVDIWNKADLKGIEHFNSEYDTRFQVDQIESVADGSLGHITLRKRNAADETEGLANAKFALYMISDTDLGVKRENCPGTPPTLQGDTGASYVHGFGDLGTGYWVGSYTTAANGNVRIDNQYLQPGWKFVLVEYEAPDGYQLPGPDQWPVRMYETKEGVTVDVEVVKADGTITIDNTSYGYELPETGGMGTMVYTLSGIAMLTLAGALFCGRQRRRARSHR